MIEDYFGPSKVQFLSWYYKNGFVRKLKPVLRGSHEIRDHVQKVITGITRVWQTNQLITEGDQSDRDPEVSDQGDHDQIAYRSLDYLMSDVFPFA